MRTFGFQILIYLTDIAQCRFPFESDAPVLNMPQNAVLDLDIQCWNLQYRHKVVHKLPGGNFGEEVITPVLYT